MRVLLLGLAVLCCSILAGVAIGRFTIEGAALAASPGPTMPRYMPDDYADGGRARDVSSGWHTADLSGQ